MSREYDLVVFGATGYTGAFTAQYIHQNFPTNLSWAIAGRSESKLQSFASSLKDLSRDRTQPRVEVCSLNPADLNKLANRTKVFINVVGPYSLYSTPVVEACAMNGTHYVDVTGEAPWVVELVEKYHQTANENGAIIVPQSGLESVPADMMAYALASKLRSSGRKTSEVLHVIKRGQMSPSGGTLASILAVMDVYGLLGMAEGLKPTAMSPTTPTSNPPGVPLMTRLFGPRNVPHIGTVTTSLTGAVDVPIVYRGWGLLESTEEAYGRNFVWRPYMQVPNFLAGLIAHVVTTFGPLLFALPPIKWLLRSLFRSPGTGPDEATGNKDTYEVVAVATAEGAPKLQAFGSFGFKGSVYRNTALILAEAAGTILYDGEKTIAKKIGGGVLTSATLGQPFLDRLSKAGLEFQTKLLD